MGAHDPLLSQLGIQRGAAHAAAEAVRSIAREGFEGFLVHVDNVLEGFAGRSPRDVAPCPTISTATPPAAYAATGYKRAREADVGGATAPGGQPRTTRHHAQWVVRTVAAMRAPGLPLLCLAPSHCMRA